MSTLIQMNQIRRQLSYGLILLWVASIPLSTAASGVLNIILMLNWLFIRDPNKWRMYLAHPVMLALWPFVLMGIVSIWVSPIYLGHKLEAANDLLRLCSIGILMYYFKKLACQKAALWMFVFVMLLTVMAGLMKLYWPIDIGVKYQSGAVFKHHIITSYLISMAAIFVLVSHRNYPKKQLACISLFIIFTYYLLLMNVGRIGIILLISCSGIYLFQTATRKQMLYSLGIFITGLVVAIGLSAELRDRIFQLLVDWQNYQQGIGTHDTSLGARLTFAISSLKLVFQKPILGWGLGSFSQIYQELYQSTGQLMTDNPHNEYLRIMVECGIFGLALMMVWFVALWKASFQVENYLGGIFRLYLIGFAIGCLFNSWLSDFTEMTFFTFFVSCLLANLNPVVLPKFNLVPRRYAQKIS